MPRGHIKRGAMAEQYSRAAAEGSTTSYSGGWPGGHQTKSCQVTGSGAWEAYSDPSRGEESTISMLLGVVVAVGALLFVFDALAGGDRSSDIDFITAPVPLVASPEQPELAASMLEAASDARASRAEPGADDEASVADHDDAADSADSSEVKEKAIVMYLLDQLTR